MANFQPIDYWSPNNLSFHAAVFSSTTVNGVATFILTKDGTPEGEAIFRNIFSVFPAAQVNTSSAIEVPHASPKNISSDKKTVTVNVTVNLDTSVSFAPDGTLVYLHTIGD